MPKVSDEHIINMQEQILQSAVQCFAVNGFHATGMAEIIKESGLSAGSVYRYYESKEALIIAIVKRYLYHMAVQMTSFEVDETITTPVALVENYLYKMREIYKHPDVALFARAVPQIWAEVLRNPQISVLVRDDYEMTLSQFENQFKRMQEVGNLDKSLNTRSLAQMVWSLVQGFILQGLLFGNMDKSGYLESLRTLIDHPLSQKIDIKVGCKKRLV